MIRWWPNIPHPCRRCELIPSLAADHRAIEAELERLGEKLAAGEFDDGIFRRVREMLLLHYRREEFFLARLSEDYPDLASKLRGQHAEALEIAERLAESFAAGHTGDVMYLGRRFLAITQHNMIEEERDAFPLYSTVKGVL